MHAVFPKLPSYSEFYEVFKELFEPLVIYVYYSDGSEEHDSNITFYEAYALLKNTLDDNEEFQVHLGEYDPETPTY